MTIRDERVELIKSIISDEKITAEEDEALHMLLQETVSQDATLSSDKNLTFGQKSADNLAKFAGSWGFIIIFFAVLLSWILVNIFITRPFDVYPFILLNLLLSCLAAIQAPVIMMSQNRQESKDRQRAKNDYKVNLKAEIMVEDIHQKLDSIIEKQEALVERLITLETKRISKNLMNNEEKQP